MAEGEEGLWMSTKERDRLKVLHEVRKRHITQRQAALELGMSVRWVRTLLKRLRVDGDSGLRHRLRGRASNRKAPEELRRRAVEVFRQKNKARLWHDAGHLSRKLCLTKCSALSLFQQCRAACV